MTDRPNDENPEEEELKFNWSEEPTASDGEINAENEPPKDEPASPESSETSQPAQPSAPPTKPIAKKTKKRSPYLIPFIFLFWGTFFGGIIGVMLLFQLVSMGYFGELPTFEELENPQTAIATEVYSADSVLLGKFFNENRSNVKYDDLSPNLINALMATEDIRYKEHSGIDAYALARVFYGLATGKSAGGGSTITQQLAKNLFHDKPKSTIERGKQKLKEWVISARLESRYTKKEIIQMYLNTVEFSDNAFGIKSASRTYFNTTPDSLKVEQAAVLVGMLKAPYTYNPRINKENSTNRRNVVLGQMLKYEFLEKAEYDSLVNQEIALKYRRTEHDEGQAPYFRMYVRDELKRLLKDKLNANNEPIDLYRDGLRVYTTLNSRMQQMGEEAVNEHMSSLQKQFIDHWKKKDPWTDFKSEWKRIVRKTPQYQLLKSQELSDDSIDIVMSTPVPTTVFSYTANELGKFEKDTLISPYDSLKYSRMHLQTGFLVLDSKTGDIKVWVGGVNYNYFKYDHINSRRQVGSTFKPFIYTLALDNQMRPCDQITDKPIIFEDYDNWTPSNSDGKYSYKDMTLMQCLQRSQNTCSAYLIKNVVKPKTVVDFVNDELGITTDIDTFPAICLGTPEVSLYEMASAYTSFANNGIRSQPQVITQVFDKNGSPINLRNNTAGKRVIGEEINFLMVEMLRSVINRGTGQRVRYRYKLTADVGGKTGTTQEHADGWFIGFTPELVGGVWTGGEDRVVRFRRIDYGQGAHMALPVWGLFFQKLYADEELGYEQTTKFEKPPGEPIAQTDCSPIEEDLSEDDEDVLDTGPTRYGDQFD